MCHTHKVQSLQPSPVSLQLYISVLIDHLPSIPLSRLTALSPNDILLAGVTAFLPFLQLLVAEAGSSEPVCTLLFPALAVAKCFE
jgi:hypothetical protein